jgi:hypothetical protein
VIIESKIWARFTETDGPKRDKSFSLVAGSPDQEFRSDPERGQECPAAPARCGFRPSNAAFAILSGARAHDPRRDGRAFLPAYGPRDESGIRLPR